LPRHAARRSALAVLLALALLPLAPPGSTASITITPSRAAALPPGLTALPPELDRHMRDLVRAAEHFRGLRLEHAVPRGAIDETTLRKAMSDDLGEDLPPAKMAAVETALKAFGFIPETMSLATYYPELLSSQTAGFYDSKRKYLAIVRRKGSLLADGGPAAASPGGSPDAARRMEDAVLVHEVTHAIQDQHFDLQKLTATDPLLDASLADTALAEGDATLTMLDFLAGRRVESSPELARDFERLMADPRQMLAAAASDPAAREMTAAPAWLRDTLLFSYSRGFAFCMSVRRHGGQRLLDHAFRTDPPRSTEQILHPEKWYGRRDDPIVIAWPDLAAELPGWSRAATGEMGEEGIRILLNQALHEQHRADVAAAGWGGDRFAVYEKSGNRLLAWITEWDTGADAQEFQDAAAALGPDWLLRRAAPRRVTLVRGTLSPADRTAVETALAGAKSVQPANHPIASSLSPTGAADR
jgi:hypothetical protein